MSRPLHIGDLHPTRDKPAVFAWLRSHLRWHLATWSAAAGLGWDEAEIDARMDGGLLAREWNILAEAAEVDDQLVAVAREGHRAVGIVHALEQRERYLEIPMGVLAWIFVAPVSRGSGASDLLLTTAHEWMRARGVRAAEVFVAADNEAARRLYRRHRYQAVDHRLLATLEETDDPG
ncbi:GNAT family N-acetyltransferase [Haliangium sp.]|uniref:GNAT family N-acetyltransferase n=1 Tax=Haliangium sp. TaxID=2663208 RepID=UPI003D110894